MREIRFRSKRIDNGEWVYGCLTRYSEEMSYITVDAVNNYVFQVKAKTVGQYTGLKDKHGNPIYEGDILRHFQSGDIFKVHNIIPWSREIDDWLSWPEEYEVIGDIYQNPELL